MSELSEEEKKAIENLKEVVNLYNDECLITTDYDFKSIEIILNLIEKQQKEIEELKDTRTIFNMGRRSYKNEIEYKIKAKIEDIINSENSEAIEKLIEWQSLLDKE